MQRTFEITETDLESLLTRIVGRLASKKLTLKQLSDEWGCSKQSILNWIALDEHPLPVHYIGADPRFNRYEIDLWSKENAKRKLRKHRASVEKV